MTDTTKSKRPSGTRTTAAKRRSTNTLAARMRARRKELGWTQAELASRVDTTQAVVQKIENEKSLRPRILEEIAAALGVSPAWLMYGDTAPTCAGVDEEALAVGRSWNALAEPHRSAMRDIIYHMIEGRGSRRAH